MIIYKLTNTVNGKAYVGQTIQAFKKRIGQHRNNRKSFIGQAIRKYGWENFKAEILEECSSYEELDEREKYWIAFFNTMVPNGYNLTSMKRYAQTPEGRNHLLSASQKAKVARAEKRLNKLNQQSSKEENHG